MKRVLIEEVRLERFTVKDALDEVPAEMLPISMRISEDVRWILKFANVNAPKSLFQEVLFRRGSSPDEQMLEEYLDSNIRFYFESLFVFGRQQKVSSYALEGIEKALLPANIEKSIDINLKRKVFVFTSRFPFVKRDASFNRYNLVKVLLHAKTEHNATLAEIDIYWKIWQREVRTLRQHLDSSMLFERIVIEKSMQERMELVQRFTGGFSYKSNLLYFLLKDDRSAVKIFDSYPEGYDTKDSGF